MADVDRLPFSSHSLPFTTSSSSSSSLLVITSFASNLNSLPLSPNCLFKRIYPVVCSTARVVSRSPFAAPRKQSLSFKLCRTAEDRPEILFLKVNFDENKPLCKSLNVKVLPYFHFYRGADGQLESLSCSLAKFQKIKNAIELHNTARCSIGPPKGVGELTLESITVPKDKSPGSAQT